MPYTISGTVNSESRILVLKQSDWTLEHNSTTSGNSYSISTTSGTKVVIARENDTGYVVGFGGISPVYSAPTGGDRGLFGGGYDDSGRTATIVYNTISTTGNSSSFGNLTAAIGYVSATSNGYTGRGIFGGGYTTDSTNVISYVTITNPGNATDFGDLTVARRGPTATSNNTNDRGTFITGSTSGSNSSITNVIDYVTVSTTGNASDFVDTLYATKESAATSNGTSNRGVVGGGINSSSTSLNTINYITISSAGNATDFGELTTISAWISATSSLTNNRGIFAGGSTDTNTNTNVIGYITISSAGNASDFGDLSGAAKNGAGTSNGTNNRGIFNLGYVSAVVNTIEYITISNSSNSTDFGDLVAPKEVNAATSNA